MIFLLLTQFLFAEVPCQDQLTQTPPFYVSTSSGPVQDNGVEYPEFTVMKISRPDGVFSQVELNHQVKLYQYNPWRTGNEVRAYESFRALNRKKDGTLPLLSAIPRHSVLSLSGTEKEVSKWENILNKKTEAQNDDRYPRVKVKYVYENMPLYISVGKGKNIKKSSGVEALGRVFHEAIQKADQKFLFLIKGKIPFISNQSESSITEQSRILVEPVLTKGQFHIKVCGQNKYYEFNNLSKLESDKVMFIKKEDLLSSQNVLPIPSYLKTDLLEIQEISKEFDPLFTLELWNQIDVNPFGRMYLPTYYPNQNKGEYALCPGQRCRIYIPGNREYPEASFWVEPYAYKKLMKSLNQFTNTCETKCEENKKFKGSCSLKCAPQISSDISFFSPSVTDFRAGIDGEGEPLFHGPIGGGHLMHWVGRCFDIRPMRKDDLTQVTLFTDANHDQDLTYMFMNTLIQNEALLIQFNGPRRSGPIQSNWSKMKKNGLEIIDNIVRNGKLPYLKDQPVPEFVLKTDEDEKKAHSNHMHVCF